MPLPLFPNGVNGDRVASSGASQLSQPGSFLDAATGKEATILVVKDKLRALGIDRHYDLPQIVVCGARSAGKSSVLETITEIPFPRKAETCTRYVTKVTIERKATEFVEVRIVPASSRPSQEAKKLREFKRGGHGPQGQKILAAYMREADDLIFAGSASELITGDIVVITISAPQKRPLQLLDLPGLFYDHTGVGYDVRVDNIVKQYMTMSQSIILAVVKASEDLNNQIILKLCRDYDPEGVRTLGIITGPDAAEPRQADIIIRFMYGEDMDFRCNLNWHVLLNRNTEELERNSSQAERDKKEEDFFQREPWNKVSREDRGIDALKSRLRDQLFSVEKRELSAFRHKIIVRKEQLQNQYEDLGGDPLTDGQVISVFRQATRRLRDAARDHARGIWESDIPDNNSPIYLRSRVQDQEEVFRDKLNKEGHTWHTLIKAQPLDPESDLRSLFKTDEPSSENPKQTRYKGLNEEIAVVSKMLQQSRRQELPSFWDPARVNALFWKMSDRWHAIAEAHVEVIFELCKDYFEAITPTRFRRTSHLSPSDGFANSSMVSERFVRDQIVPRLSESCQSAKEELHKLEEDRLGLAKNLDLRFLQDMGRDRHQRGFSTAMKAYHMTKGEDISQLDSSTYTKSAELFSQEQEIESVAKTYLAAMWSHYLIVRDNFIANVSVQVIERHFLRHIERIVPDEIDLETAQKLIREDDETGRLKKKIMGDINILKSSIKALGDC